MMASPSSKLVSILRKLWENDQTLASLDFSTSSDTGAICDKGVASIAAALRVNSAVTDVCFRRNKIGQEGAESIAEALRSNNTLEKLDVGENPLGEEGVESLVGAIQSNSTVAELDLSYTDSGPAGGVFVAKLLESNSTLRRIGLSGNAIDDETVEVIAHSLLLNSALEVLDLSYNEIGDDGAASLAAALDQNASLVSLKLSQWTNICDEESKSAIVNSLRRNTAHKARRIYIGVGEGFIPTILARVGNSRPKFDLNTMFELSRAKPEIFSVDSV